MCLILFLLVLDAIFSFSYPWKTTARGENLGLIAFAFGALALLCLYRRKRKIGNFARCIAIVAAAAFVVQAVLMSMLYAYARGDAGTVSEFARRLVYGEEQGDYLAYFSSYRNNLFLAECEAAVIWACRLLHIGNWRLVLILLGCAAASGSGVLFAFTARRVCKSDAVALLFYGIFIGYVVLSPRNTVPYSDVYGMIFPIAALFLLSLPLSGGRRFGANAGAGALAMIGAALKPTAAIVLIAACLVGAVKLCCAADRKERAISLGCLVGGALAGYLLTAALLLLLPYSFDDEQKIGLWHYLMMGANESTTGTYSAEDNAFSKSFLTAAERAAANRAEFFARVKDMGFFGYLGFLGRKLLCTFGDGAFGWAYECEFVTGIPETNAMGSILRALFRAEGAAYRVYAVCAQAVWCFLLVCMVGNVFARSDETGRVVSLTICGVVLYQLLFEAGARYLYLFLPFFLLSAASGFVGWRAFVREKRTERKIGKERAEATEKGGEEPKERAETQN